MTTPAVSSTRMEPADNVRRAAAFLARLLPERSFDIRLWDGSVIHGSGESRLALVINAPGALRRMFRLPIELSLGEAYLRGDFDLEGDVWEAGPALAAARQSARSTSELLTIARLWRSLPRDRNNADATARFDRPAAELGAAERSRDWDRAGIRYHYDAGNDFFALFLDRRMVYSCAYFPKGTEDLDTAQERKLEYICRKLRLRASERLLDIGCGWGGLVIHAARHHGVHALGVTLSEQQHALASERIRQAGLERLAEVRCLDYRDIRGEVFDKVVSVGMFEHVGEARLPEYFGHVFQLLKPNGLFLNHGIAGRPRSSRGLGSSLTRALEPWLVGGSTFRQRYVFPTGDLVPVSRANLVAEEAGFEVRDVESLREHYMRTLRHWASRLGANAEEAVRVGGAAMYRLWRLYLGIAAWQFEVGEFGVYQSLLEKPAGGPSQLPLTRADLYA
jgi:cyclopropane-fatty-acyl-phospholipid synthase